VEVEQQRADLEERPEPRWGLGDVLLGVGLGYVLATVLGGIWLAISGVDAAGAENSTGLFVFSEIGLWLGIVGVPVWACRRKGSRSLARDFGLRFEWRDLGIGVLAAVVMSFIVLPALNVLVRGLLGGGEAAQSSQNLARNTHGPGVAALVGVFVLGAPIAEEIFFRGLLLRALRRRFGNVVAVIGSGLAFGLVHLEAGSWRDRVLIVVLLGSLGVALGILAVRLGRIGAGIVAHMVFNLLAVIVLLSKP
jgi:membrane protease YdiL (CAAX protease family)